MDAVWRPGTIVMDLPLGRFSWEETMPEPHIDGWVQLIVHATQEGNDRVTTHNVEITPALASPIDATQIATDFWADVGTIYRGVVHNSVNFDYVECRTLYDQPTNYAGIYFIPQPAPGGQSGEALPGNCAAGIRWKTGVRGRKYRGRNNLFGLAENQTTGSLLNSNTILLIAQLASAILGWQPTGAFTSDNVVASRVGLFLTDVIAYTIDQLVDSQRTRLLQRGD